MHLLGSSNTTPRHGVVFPLCLKLINTCYIFKKWIVERGNESTKIKVQQRNGIDNARSEIRMRCKCGCRRNR
jgi:hypothetical protein